MVLFHKRVQYVGDELRIIRIPVANHNIVIPVAHDTAVRFHFEPVIIGILATAFVRNANFSLPRTFVWVVVALLQNAAQFLGLNVAPRLFGDG